MTNRGFNVGTDRRHRARLWLVHLTRLLHDSILWPLQKNESKQISSLALTSLVCVQTFTQAQTSPTVYAFTKIVGRIVSEGERRLYFFLFLSPFFFCTISCLQKPLMPIQHQHQGTALMSILATAFFLSPLPAALSPSLSLYILLLYPHLIPSLALYGYTTIT